MGNILGKIGHFFEVHVEKIVLVVFGILSLYVLLDRVLFSPNMVEFDGQTFAPGKIDRYIDQQFSGPVRDRLQGAPTSLTEYEPLLTGPIDPCDAVLVDTELKGTFDQGFMGLYRSALRDIDDRLYPPQPRHSAAESTERRKYPLPFIGEVQEVKSGYIRAAAYFPVEEITDETSYDDVQHEPNDLDLVTVEGKFDFGMLRQRFFESFASEDLPVEWRDETLAEPVCAAVNLQRQELLPDGRWSTWQDVPRLAIDHQPELMTPVTRVEDLPSGGVRVRMLQLDKYDVRQDLLQPLPYEIATTYEEWFPPSLHVEYLKLRDQERKEARREKREAEADQDVDARGRPSRGGSRTSTTGRGGAGRGGPAMDAYGGIGGGTQQDRRSRGRGGRSTARGGGDQLLPGAPGQRTRGTRGRGRTQGGAGDPLYGAAGMDAYGMGPGGMGVQNQGVNQMSGKFREVSLTFDKDMAKLDEFLFWAHDATVAPEKIYRYRIRLGVLNPAAGINDDSQPQNNDVVLWSEFSSVTDTVYIPRRSYFFAKGYKEASGVSVEVMKFYQGYWRSQDFSVKPGETVGAVVELEEEEDPDTLLDPTAALYGAGYGMMNPGQRQEPLTVDYRTGAVLVDAVPVDGWTGGKRLRPQSHHAMLYSQDEQHIHKMPIGRPNWPESLALAYNRAKQFQKEEVEDFRDFGSSLVRGVRSGRGGLGGPGMDMYGESMMYGR